MATNGQPPGTTTVHVVTGNLTCAGTIVYLSADGSWQTALERARAFEREDEAKAELARVRVDEAEITEPYVFAAASRDGRVGPSSAREILRAAGPSTRLRRPD